MEPSVVVAIGSAVAAICGAPLFTYLVSRAKNDTDLAHDERQALRKERERIEEERRKEIVQLKLDKANQADVIRDLEARFRKLDEEYSSMKVMVDRLVSESKTKDERIAHLEYVVEQQEEAINRLRVRNIELYEELRQKGT